MKSDFVPCALPLSPLSVYLYSFMEINIQICFSFLACLYKWNGGVMCDLAFSHLTIPEELPMLLFFILSGIWQHQCPVMYLGFSFQKSAWHCGGSQQAFKLFPLFCLLKNRFLTIHLSHMWTYWHRIELEVLSPRVCAQFFFKCFY